MDRTPTTPLRSLAYRTDLLFHAAGGEVLARDGYLVVRTPSNPTYFWGNFCLFDAPPLAGDRARWEAIFAAEFADLPVEHLAFGWDSPEGDRGAMNDEFLAAGYEPEDVDVLASASIGAPPHPAAGVEVRRIEGDWARVLALQIEIGVEGGYERAAYAPYKEKKIRRYRAMVEAGVGTWWGAFAPGAGEPRLVGDLGVFVTDEGLARYQAVETAPDHRRRGIAATLVSHAGRAALAAGAGRCVLVVDRENPAARVYRSVGLELVEIQLGVMRYDRSVHGGPPREGPPRGT